MPAFGRGAPPPSLLYARSVAELMACPFCRAMFTQGEAARCEECGIALQPLHALPPSAESVLEEEAERVNLPPELRELPLTYVGRGRGALLGLAAAGLGLFFAPWVTMFRPEELVLSGFDLAHGRAGFLWGGAIAYFILIPLVLTRRSIAAMRGVRIIATLFAVLTVSEIAMLYFLRPQGNGRVPLAYEFDWGFWLSGAVSVAATYVAVRLGGRVERIEALPWTDGAARRETSDGEILN